MAGPFDTNINVSGYGWGGPANNQVSLLMDYIQYLKRMTDFVTINYVGWEKVQPYLEEINVHYQEMMDASADVTAKHDVVVKESSNVHRDLLLVESYLKQVVDYVDVVGKAEKNVTSMKSDVIQIKNDTQKIYEEVDALGKKYTKDITDLGDKYKSEITTMGNKYKTDISTSGDKYLADIKTAGDKAIADIAVLKDEVQDLHDDTKKLHDEVLDETTGLNAKISKMNGLLTKAIADITKLREDVDNLMNPGGGA
ncbi:hypothetical protein PQC38_gp117 [Aeromonas phage BUCT695]|uniref:hypothetical protein n=1 Tax=Aeromonas phage BUCT695 TaxID=2908630 RepID=UPI0023296486|nr:hypothetical protein PQC38_gp117 [Aeromonas phage BUCT695]UIW10593.1 hypothetical protein [Aeromonas phage BUCT695]